MEGLTGLHAAAPEENGIRIQNVDHLVDVSRDRVGLSAENDLSERIAFLGESANFFRGIADVHLRERVVGESGEVVGKQIEADSGEADDRLQIIDPAAVAVGGDLLGGVPVAGESGVTELGGIADFANHNPTVHDNSSSQAGADDEADRAFGGIVAEGCSVPIESSGVGVVEIADGFADEVGKATAHIKVPVTCVSEVGTAGAAHHAFGAGRAGGIEADGGDLIVAPSGEIQCGLVCHPKLIETDFGARRNEAWDFVHSRNQEVFTVKRGDVDRRPSEIKADILSLCHRAFNLPGKTGEGRGVLDPFPGISLVEPCGG